MAQHIGQETSMEEILSSIKRVIQEGGDRPSRRGAPSETPVGRETPFAAPDGDEDGEADEAEVLELTEAVDPRDAIADDGALVPEPTPDQDAADWRRVAEPAPASASARNDPAQHRPPAAPEPQDEDGPAILSATTVEASRAALASLGRMVVKEAGQDMTLEAMVREMLRPMLQQWLDANLPRIVERMVAAEVARITGNNN